MFIVAALLLTACEGEQHPASSANEPAPRVAPVSSQVSTTQSSPLLRQVSYADIVARVAPGVVTVRAAREFEDDPHHPFLNDPRMREFFDGYFHGAQPHRRVQMALASGVIVQPNGVIVTNLHVIKGAKAINVETADHRMFKARMVAADTASDLAVIKIEAKDLVKLTFGDSDRVRVGDVVLAIGNPLGVGETVTAGIISAKARSTGLGNGMVEDFLQTDAPINQGNSGGALINTQGELIGINSQILSPSGGNIGIGFAIPSNMVHHVVEQLITLGKVRRSRLGVAIESITPNLASHVGLNDPRGAMIVSVVPDSPAAQAGMRPGDIILAFNGSPVTDANILRSHVTSTAPETEVQFTILRDGRKRKIQATLGEYQEKSLTG